MPIWVYYKIKFNFTVIYILTPQRFLEKNDNKMKYRSNVKRYSC
jgi:hypothetical protein